MIRDRIVVGIHDNSLSECLQMDSNLTLEKAKTQVQQREAVQEQQILLKNGQKEDKSVDFERHNVPKSRAQRTPNRRVSSRTQQKGGKCSRCGRGPHSRQQCPARDAECHNCKKKGHYSAKCFQRTIADVDVTANVIAEKETDLYDMANLNTVLDSEKDTTWSCTVLLNDQEVKFKLDTGADVTVISDDL